MSNASESWTFSCPDLSTKLLHAQNGRARSFTVFRIPLLLLAIICICLFAQYPILAAADSNVFTRPQVLVLVLGGFGPSEQCSISYDSVVALPKAQSDLDTIAAAGKWQVRDAKGVTKSSGGPKPVPTTSISFSAKGLINYADGTLPLEPFLSGLKRFKYIEIDYITPSGFAFHGLKDFENDFVKIQMSQNESSYRYRVIVKDANFTKLDLPLREAEPKTEESGGSGARRVVIAIGLAVVAAVAAYVLVMAISKRRQ